MKKAIDSSCRDTQNRSKKTCVCGGHGAKKRLSHRQLLERVGVVTSTEAPTHYSSRYPSPIEIRPNATQGDRSFGDVEWGLT